MPYVIIHNTGTPSCDSSETCRSQLEDIRHLHMEEYFFPQGDVPYSFMVGGDGNVYEGRGWTREGRHTLGYDDKSIGIAFIGRFEMLDAGQEMIDAARQLINCEKSNGRLRRSVRVLGIRQVIQNSLESGPGTRLYAQIQKWPE